jgi:hypothetical protein
VCLRCEVRRFAFPAGFASAERLWGFEKTRYRGIAKNLARAQTMFALANPTPSAAGSGHRG